MRRRHNRLMFTFTSLHEFYDSSWQQPVLLLVSQFLFLILALVRCQKNWGVFQRLGLIFFATSMLDAVATANQVPIIQEWPPLVKSILPTFFVILGDFRVFFSVTRLYFQKSKWLLSIACSLVTPIASMLLMKILFGQASDSMPLRILFLVYELTFVVFYYTFYQTLQRMLRDTSDPIVEGDTRVSVRDGISLQRLHFTTIVFYVFWIVADILLLMWPESRIGYSFRIFANVTYYAFLPYVILTIPSKTNPNL